MLWKIVYFKYIRETDQKNRRIMITRPQIYPVNVPEERKSIFRLASINRLRFFTADRNRQSRIIFHGSEDFSSRVKGIPEGKSDHGKNKSPRRVYWKDCVFRVENSHKICLYGTALLLIHRTNTAFFVDVNENFYIPRFDSRIKYCWQKIPPANKFRRNIHI